jgi:hypothetical protein
VCEEFAELLKGYRLTKVFGDRYGGEFPRELFRKAGINYEVSDKTRSELYLDFLPLVNSRAVDLIDNTKLVAQLVGLERRTARSGKDSVDHMPGSHDDIANCVAGAICKAWSLASYSTQASEFEHRPRTILGREQVRHFLTRPRRSVSPLGRTDESGYGAPPWRQ